MKELFYFDFADLLVLVEYRPTNNSLQYTTHRQMTVGERKMIEQYLLATFARKTEYHQRQPALLVCLDPDTRLVERLHELRAKTAWHESDEKDEIVNDAVRGLVGRAMQNYYFEKIGDAMLEARREPAAINAGLPAKQRSRRKGKLEELVNAYNIYSDQKITIDAIIPPDLKPLFGISTDPGPPLKTRLRPALFAD